MPVTLESLPVELITAVLEELDIASLIVVSYLSRRLHIIASDRSLNPWRAPILRNIHSGVYEDSMKHLSVRMTVPRQNWIEVASMAKPAFLLFDATLPNMKEADWHECFKRRFLPGWQKWKRDSSWRETFKKCVHIGFPDTQSHSCVESVGFCTGCGTAVRLLVQLTSPGQSKEHYARISLSILRCGHRYIVLNKNGSANELEASSRIYNPLSILNDMKCVDFPFQQFYLLLRR
jgi:hypothetical protein